MPHMPLEPAATNPWRTISSTLVYRNPWTEVYEDKLAGPDGRDGLFGYIAARDAVLICPLYPDLSTVLIRQWRYVYGCSSWELPCGSIESGEDAGVAARRELAEEAAVQGARWHALPDMRPSDSRVGGVLYSYCATGLSPAEAAPDETECDLVRERVSLADAVRAAMDGRIIHIATTCLLLMVQRMIDTGELDPSGRS
jgi:8-oxo-dGTP pyrophosphatase MutT (NUDIX family)